MPRVLSVNSYHYRRGGADAVYFDHAALLESLGWENAYFAMHHPENIESEWSDYFLDEIQIGHEYGLLEKMQKATKVIYSLEAKKRLRELLSVFGADVAHLHNIYHHQSPSILSVFTEHDIPVVMTAHDLKIACPNNKMLNDTGICERCKGGNYLNLIKHKCIHGSTAASGIIAVEALVHRVLQSYRRHVGRIVVPSQFYLQKFVEWGWPEDLFRYIPNYVDASQFEPQYEAGDYLLYFGRLATEKGVDTLVQAAYQAGVPLRLAGTGPLTEALTAKVAAMDGADIQLLGFQSGTALHDLIRGARAVVLPSEWYENAPLSVLEAFALGKPVIGADIGGIPEAVQADHSGWLFKSQDTDGLAELLRRVVDLSDDAVSELGRQARSQVETRFTRQRYIDEMMAVYGELGVKGLSSAAMTG